MAASMARGEALVKTSERKSVITHGADVMLGLPNAPAFDARPRVEGIDDTPSKDVLCQRRLWSGDLVRNGVAEEEPKRGPRA